MSEKNLLSGFDDLLEEPNIHTPNEGGNTGFHDVVYQEDPIEEPEKTEITSDNVIYNFLQQKGIEDPSKMKFENEEGVMEDIAFDSLSTEEQLTILQELSDPGLDQHEIDVINYLRTNQVTLNQVIDYFAEQRLEEYLNQNPDARKEQHYSIDQYTDEELYLADLKSKYGSSFTDAELETKLNKAKEEEDIFKKEVELLRKTYKDLEDQDKILEQQKEQQKYDDLKNNLLESISKFGEISLDYTDPKSDSIVIEDEDKQKVLDYLLNQDAEGKSQFIKDIDDPNILIQLAWFRTQGQDVISGISQYWKNILKEERKEISKLRKELEKANTDSKSTVVINNDKQKNAGKTIASLWDNY